MFCFFCALGAAACIVYVLCVVYDAAPFEEDVVRVSLLPFPLFCSLAHFPLRFVRFGLSLGSPHTVIAVLDVAT